MKPVNLPQADEASIDWRKFEDRELTICWPIHPTFETLKNLCPEFEKLTGIRLHVEEEPESEWSRAVQSNLTSGKKVYDVIACASLFTWSWAPIGLLEPLDKYLKDPSLTDAGWYDFRDFPDSVMKICRWPGEPGASEGKGKLWMIPYMMEASVLAYREDALERLGLNPPDSWEDLLEAVKAINAEGGELGLRPLILRGARFLIAIGAYPSVLAGYGARDLDENLKPLYTRSEFVEASRIYVDIMKNGCPPFQEFSKVSWTDVIDLMAGGGYALTIDCDFFAYIWENPEKSKVSGKLSYAPVPKGPAGRGSKIWAWSLAIPSLSRNKEAAWLFIEWATSKQTLLSAALRGNYVPPRRSVLESEEIKEITSKWGGGTWVKAVEKTYSKYAIGSFFTPLPQQMDLINLLSNALWTALKEETPIERALKNAEVDAEKILREAGLLR